jgi:hypothetical protein
MLVTSEDINVTGIVGSATATLSSGTLVKNGTSLSTLSTTIVTGDVLAIKLTSSVSYNTTVSADLTVGSVTQTFYVTTGGENLPDSFSFTTQTGTALSTAYTSNEITVAGLEVNSSVTATLSGSGTMALIKNSIVLSTTSTTLTNGDTLAIRMTSSGSYGTTVTATLTIGSMTRTFSIQTLSQPTVAISPTSLALAYGETATVTATVTPSSVDNNITWTSSNSAVATVSSSGVVTAIGAGTATITATADLAGFPDVTDSITVAVSVTAAITEVQDFGGSSAHVTSAIPNASFVDVVLNSGDTYAFIADYIGVVAVDINASSSGYMTIAGAVDINTTERLVLSFDDSDSRLFVAAGTDGLVSVDVTTPSALAILAQYAGDYNSSAKYAWSVALAGNHSGITKAFVANCYGLDLFDVSSSSAITRLDELNISGGNCTGIATRTYKYDVAVNPTYAFVAYGDQGIQVIDWTDPSNLELNSSYVSTTCGDARGLDIAGSSHNTLFVACGTDGVDILDVTDPENIAKLSHYTLTASGASAEDVKLSNDGKFLLVTHQTGVDLLNVSNFASPAAVATYSSDGTAFASVFDSNDSYYYLADDGNGLLKLQLSYQ